MILHRSDHAATIRALRNAAPYIRLYKGKTFVVKAGGGVFGDAALTRALIEQIAILHYLGVRVVMVHGGGPQLTELTEALGVPTRMVQGRRVTDENSIDATAMVLNGLINTRILAICRELEIAAVGLSGVDAGLVRAHKRPPVQLSGESGAGRLRLRRRHRRHRRRRHPQAPRQRSHAGDQPAVGRQSRHAAQHQCRHGGGRDRRGAGCREADPVHRRRRHPRARRGSELDHLLHRSGRPGAPARSRARIVDGMLPKAKAIEDALRGGVRRVHVISYSAPDSILAEVFTNEGTGTLIVADVNALTPAEQHAS